MNTQGLNRGYMRRYMEDEKFFYHVISCLKDEFEVDVKVIKKEGKYEIQMMNYSIVIQASEASKEKSKGPYSLDRLILEKLSEAGFAFDVNRSHYIEHCFGIYRGNITISNS